MPARTASSPTNRLANMFVVAVSQEHVKERVGFELEGGEGGGHQLHGSSPRGLIQKGGCR